MLSGKVCLVTGATRGIGKGIALQLGEAGATVYITGRSLAPPPGKVGGSLQETAKEIESRGGKCIPVQCDHKNDADVESVFKRIEQEQGGQLDVLVNNAYSAVTAISDNIGKGFWETPTSVWDEVNNVGLRNHYLCAVHASRMMVPRKSGLIVNISSSGGLRYLFNVAYGVGKAAVDRMAADCGFELRKHNVAFVSLWPGPVRTEHIMNMMDSKEGEEKKSLVGNRNIQDVFLKHGETTEFAGKCIVHMAVDPKIMQKSGKVVMSVELAEQYGFKDTDGAMPSSMRSIHFMLDGSGYSKTAALVPSFIRIPHWLFAMAGSKF